MNAELYAGEPFIATTEGYLMPMDASQMYHQDSYHYMHHVPQYPYQIIQPSMVNQYMQNGDEGFISVEHTPQLPDYAVDPITSTNKQAQVSSEDAKFGALHETEVQQIIDVLHESSTEETHRADMSDSGVSETEETAAAADSCNSNSKNESIDANKTSENVENDDTPVEQNDQHSLVEFSDEAIISDIECSQLKTTNAQTIHEKQTVDQISQDSQSHEDIQAEDDEIKKCGVTNLQNIETEDTNTMNFMAELGEVNESIPATNAIVILPTITKPDLDFDKSLGLKIIQKLEKIHLSGRLEVVQEEESNQVSEVTSASSEGSVSYDVGPVLFDGTCIHDSDSLSSSSPDVDDKDDEFDANVRKEMELAQSMLNSRMSAEEAVSNKNVGANIERDPLMLNNYKVTDAVKRWIREVTPEKVFSLSEAAQSMIMDRRLEGYSEDEDEYFEDEVAESSGRTFHYHKIENLSDNNATSTMIPSKIDESAKNVRGNPFGAQRSDLYCSVNPTKRVASCSNSDALDDYDGCSTVSNLSQGALFSNTASQITSQSSSRTITPTSNIETMCDDISTKTVTYDPSGYSKYYQLAVQVDDFPTQTHCQQSSHCPLSDNLSKNSSNTVLPMAVEILNKEELKRYDENHDVTHSSNCGKSLSSPNSSKISHVTDTKSSPLSSAFSVTSAYSSGIGSSLATTPTTSPQHLPPRNNSGRLPFFFVPPNIRAENSSASLNTIHCCSLM